MGVHLNPGNEAFAEVINSEYVDKTGLIDVINGTINTINKLTCISRPRRFGKSIAASMLVAYYDCSCDSHGLFNDYQISKCAGYEEHIRESDYAPPYYNNEQALRYVIKFAYIVCVDRYMKVEELPSGKGIADVVYIPKRNRPDPALVVELKWNQSEGAAISQIKEKNYPAALEDYGGDIILVGINYDEISKKHSCVIERVTKQ